MSDDFNTRYRLLKCVAVDDGIRTHNAQELATGRVVMVHVTDAAGPETVESLRAQLAALNGAEKNKVLETATLPSGFAVVTEFLPANMAFRAWLAVASGVETAPVSPLSISAIMPAPPAPNAAPSTAPGAFTALFAAPTVAAPMGSAPPASGSPGTPTSQAPASPAAAPSTPSAPAGSFTQLFGGPSAEMISARQATKPDVLTPPAFVAPPAPVASPPAPAVPPSGAFTQMFGPGALTGNTPPSRPASPARPPAPPARTGPGEFTQMFGLPSTAAPAPEAVRPSPMNAPAAPQWSPFGDVQKQAPPVIPHHRESAFSAPPVAHTPMPPAPASPVHALRSPFAAGSHANHAPQQGDSAGQPGLSGSASSAPAVPASPLFGSAPGQGMPPILPPPLFQDVHATPLSARGGALPPSAKSAPSDFTRLIQGAADPVIPAAAKKPEAKPAKSGKGGFPIGLVVVISAVLIVTTVLVAVVWKSPSIPDRAQLTAKPKAPKIKRPTTKQEQGAAATADSIEGTIPTIAAPPSMAPVVTPPVVKPPDKNPPE